MKKICVFLSVLTVLSVFLMMNVAAYKTDSFIMDSPQGFIQSTNENQTVMFKNSQTLSNVKIDVSKNNSKTAYVSLPEDKTESMAKSYCDEFLQSVNSALSSQQMSVEAKVTDYGEREIGNTVGFYIEIEGKYIYEDETEEEFCNKSYLISNKDYVISIAALSKNESDEEAIDKALESFQTFEEALVYSGASSDTVIIVCIAIGVVFGAVLCVTRVKKKNKKASAKSQETE